MEGWGKVVSEKRRGEVRGEQQSGRVMREMQGEMWESIWKVGSCYVTCYITGGVLYHIFLLCNMLYGGVT